MKSPLPLSLLIVLGAVSLPSRSAARAADGRPVRNSFIDRPVGEIADLIAHVRADRVVADRYERHFAMDRATLLRFLGGLHRGRLAQSGIYTIYSVPQGGRLKMHVGRIRRGEPMFFNRAGQPTLVAKCGNPIVLGPSRSQHGNPVALLPEEKDGVRELGIVAVSEAAPEQLAALEPGFPTVEVALATEVAGAAPAVIGADVVPVTTTELGVGNFLASMSFLTPFAATLPVEGRADRQAVPEPLTAVAMTAGLGGLLQRRRRRS